MLAVRVRDCMVEPHQTGTIFFIHQIFKNLLTVTMYITVYSWHMDVEIIIGHK